jgi:pilus assembly protein CpaB
MRFLLLLVAAVVAIFAGVAALQLSGGAQNNSAPATAATAPASNVLTVDVLVARAPIPAGTEITAAMIDKQPWPENLVLDGFIVSTGPNADIVGKVTRAPFQAREPLITTKLASAADSGFMAAHLPEGTRAVTISTDAITGVAGFVFPGDRIDLVFTHNIPEKTRAPAKSINPIMGASASIESAAYAEILAANVTVLAVNIRDAAKDASGPAGALLGSTEAALSNVTGSSASPSSMTLQVTDAQAEKIRLAERVGNLSVSLRSLHDREKQTATPVISLANLTQVQGGHAPEQSSDEVRVIRGGDSATPSAASPGATPFSLLPQLMR